ncbi:MAG: gamma-glutamyltransferase family protein [Chloroflexi bacterium]|nr:gamma-glutamyltransferase family protein [Chloroflexota bacterium]
MKGVVTTPQPWAAEVGAQVLEAGGNAFDAAVASAFMQWVWDPFMCGPAGMGVGQVFHAATGEHKVIDFNARAGSKVRSDMWAGDVKSRTEVSHLFVFDDWRNEVGHTSVMTPGSVAAMAEINRRWGTMPWGELLQPAIQQARAGIPVHPTLHDWFIMPPFAGQPDALQRIKATDECARVFLKKDGTLPRFGDVIGMSDMANTLDALARKGPREFYEGDLARAMADDILKNGGFVTYDDLSAYTPRIQEPLWGTYRDNRVATVRPSHSGMTLLQLFALVEPFELWKKQHGSADMLHVVAAAMSLAHRDRLEHNADPEFADVPVEKILSKKHIGEQRQRIREWRKGGTGAGVEAGHTTNVCATDEQGNMVALTHTLGWASGAVTPGLGFVYNNSMNLADPTPGRPNSIAPGKSRGSNMIPSMVFKDGKPFLAVGALGGAVIISAVFQVMQNVLDFGMTLTEATAAPRIHCEGGKVFAEARLRSDVETALEAKGHSVSREVFAYSPIQARSQAVMRRDDGSFDAGSDPRAGGGGVAYSQR